MTDPAKSTEQKAAEARREAMDRLDVLCRAHPDCPCDDIRAAIDRALALARLEVAEGMHTLRCRCCPEPNTSGFCKPHGIWKHTERDPRCAAERDRYRKEADRADREA